MPTVPTSPGVYIEEVPGGAHPIAGVATSITAFLGRALRGPTDEARAVTSFGDFEQVFGGLHQNFMMSYAVRDFFANGGSQAVIVRLYKGVPGKPSKARFEIRNLNFEAASEGAWGMKVRVRVEKRDPNDPGVKGVAERLGVQPTDIFDLIIHDGGTGVNEMFLNLTTKESFRRVDRVLMQKSILVRIPGNQPLPRNDSPNKHSGAITDPDVWTNDGKSTAAKTGIADDAVDSAPLTSVEYIGSQAAKSGMYMLDKVDLFNLLCIPADVRGGDLPDDVYQEALTYCYTKRRAMLIVDPKAGWTNVMTVGAGVSGMNLSGNATRNAAIYYPRIRQSDPNLGGQIDTFVPCGMIAGVMARIDAQKGIWKAPAGTDATLNGVESLQVEMTDADSRLLNLIGVNCLRSLPNNGRVVWGARTMRGTDIEADEYDYVPVRRLALFIEESIHQGTQWVVFEPNDEPLWAQIRLNVGSFMLALFRQGAFQGRTPDQAYFVKCDRETNTQTDIDNGIVNFLVGFAPLRPAEFVIIKMGQTAGQSQS